MTQRAHLSWHGTAATQAIQAAAVQGVRMAAEHVLTESRKRVPIEEATLERSGVATVDEATLTAAVSYDTPYAVRQHENLNYRHDNGRSAKYLESVLPETADVVEALLAAQIRRALRS
jgi:hypothetical protein